MKLYKNKNWLEEKYLNEKLSIHKLAKECKVYYTLIRWWLIKNNIKIRSRSESQKGRKHSEETKIKMGNAHRGRIISEEQKMKQRNAMKGKLAGKNNPMYGIHRFGKDNPNYGNFHTEEMKKEYSITRKGKYTMEKNPNWNGGTSFEPYGLEFNNALKESIRERDNYECQFCGIKQNGKRHPIHHINYNKKDNQPKNLITLCERHNIKANFNRNKWQFFFDVYQELRGSNVQI